MLLIRDIKDNLVATGDQKTGEVIAKHGDREVKVPLAEDQTITLTRKGTVTNVTWSHGSFVIDRRYAA